MNVVTPIDKFDWNEIPWASTVQGLTPWFAVIKRVSPVANKINPKTRYKIVLNLGYGHNGPLFEYVILREYIQKNTKKILWLYYEGNDQSDLNVELNNKFLNYYLLDNKFSQKLITRQPEVDELIKKKFLIF